MDNKIKIVCIEEEKYTKALNYLDILFSQMVLTKNSYDLIREIFKEDQSMIMREVLKLDGLIFNCETGRYKITIEKIYNNGK